MSEITEVTAADPIEQAALIVAAYVGNNHVPQSDLPGLIRATLEALQTAATGSSKPAEIAPLQPAVSVKKSLTDDFIICLEDGKKFKSLKRHLMTHFNMTPAEYRQKWSLPRDYPMVAPNYAAARSALAKTSGLGRKAVAEPAEVTAEPAVEAPERTETATPAAHARDSHASTPKTPKRRAPRKLKTAA